MANWNWGIGEETTPDPRRALPVFATLPNWQGGVTERLSWLTDLMSSEQSVEQRRSARRYPRRSFEAGFLRADTYRSRLDMFLTGTGRAQCLVPLWHDQHKLGQPTGDMTVPFPAGTLQYREFRLDDLVLVTAGDPQDFDVLTVTGVNLANDTLTLQARTATRPWLPGTRLIPLRRARMLETATLSQPSDRVGVIQARFELSDADTNFPPSWGYCAPLWRHRPDRATPVDFDYARTAYMIDAQGGVIDVVDPGDRAQIGTKIAAQFHGLARVYGFRQFLHAARGRAARFYMPTWTSDLEPTGDLSGDSFDVKPMGITDYLAGPQEARRILAIQFHDGRPVVYRTIDTVGAVKGLTVPFRTIAERIFVTETLPPINLADIERISFVVPSRFDQDTFELQHHTDGSKVVSTSLITRSVTANGMPPIDCSTTSKPYPMNTLEAMLPGSTATGGTMSEPTIEHLGSSAFVSGGTLRAPLTKYENGEPEGILAAATVGTGTLRQVLRSYDGYTPEGISSGATVGTGTLKAVLLNHEVAPEAIGSTAFVLGGTLS